MMAQSRKTKRFLCLPTRYKICPTHYIVSIVFILLHFCIQFNPTFFRKKRFLHDFIDLYKSQPPLWDVNHVDFENAAVRKECERAIISGMQKFNVYLKSTELNRALNRVQKYCAIIKHTIEETAGQKKLPVVTMGYYRKCDFLKELIIKNNISGYRDLSKTVRIICIEETQLKRHYFKCVLSFCRSHWISNR